MDGVEVSQAFKNAVPGQILGVKVKVIALADLIRNKKSSGREKDRLDSMELQKLKKAKA